PNIRVWRKGRGGRREERVRSRVGLAHRLDHVGREFFVNRVPRVDCALPPRPELPVELRHLALPLRDGHRALPEGPQDVGTHREATGAEQVPYLTGDTLATQERAPPHVLGPTLALSPVIRSDDRRVRAEDLAEGDSFFQVPPE